jgi:segregation and condensation protein A
MPAERSVASPRASLGTARRRPSTPEETAFETELAADRAATAGAGGRCRGLQAARSVADAGAPTEVDLAKISILALADQYLAFIDEARRLRLELAADYLVMAAWLAYLKSRLLLPEAATPEGMSAEDMANALALRLKRLEAIRDAAQKLFDRPQLDRDVFARGQPEPIAHIKHPQWTATLYDLLTAYASQRQKSALSHVRMAKRAVWSLAEARSALERLIGAAADWTRIDEYLIAYIVEPSQRATVLASSFASALELVREGVAEIHRAEAFAPLFMRKRDAAEWQRLRPRRTEPLLPEPRGNQGGLQR